MRWLILAAAVFLGGHVALAQIPPPEKEFTLTLPESRVKLIVETLKAIGCQNVAQSIVCDDAKDLLREILRQAKEQTK